MNKAFRFSKSISSVTNLQVTTLLIATLIALLPISRARAQNPPQTPPATPSWVSPPQATAADKQNFPPLLLQQLSAIKAAALNDDYAYREVAHLTENIGPRPSGSPQAVAAAQYVAAELRHLGLDVRLQQVTVPHWVRGAETAALVEYPGMVPGTTQKIILTALGGSSSTPPDGLTADVIAVDTFDELQALGHDKVAGKIVLFNELFDKQKAAGGYAFAAYGEAVRYRGAGAKAAADLGAVAALVRSVASADYRLPHTGFSFAAGIPAGAVTAEDADLIAHLAAQGKVRMHLTLTPQKLPDETSYNVIADLKGSEHPEQIVIVSGHLDSWDLGTGATDDGAGMAIVFGAARLIAGLPQRPSRTIRLVLFGAEEMNFSAAAYAKAHEGEAGQIVVAGEADFGARNVYSVQLPGGAAGSDFGHTLQRVIAPLGANVDRRPALFGGDDIGELQKAGVPVASLRQDGLDYFDTHHTADDTLDKIDPKQLGQAVAVWSAFAYLAAASDVDFRSLAATAK